MKLPFRTRLLAALAVVGAGVAAGVLATAPTGCASDCGSSCPVTTAVIESSDSDIDPIYDFAVMGPACPPLVMCRGNDQTTFCNHISLWGIAEGYCDVLIHLMSREPMAVRIEFGPPTTQGCCKGYPVVGESYFIIPSEADAGIQGAHGPSDAVRVLRDGGQDSEDGATDGGASDATDDGSAPD